MPTRLSESGLFLIAAFAIICLFSPLLALAQELPPQDAVFLVDASGEDGSHLPAVTGIVQRFVAGARPGDSFTCYQFSNKPLLVAKGKINRKADIGDLKRQLLQLHEAEVSTNYSPAIERGLADLLQVFQQHPAHERLLVLITDGRSTEDNWSERFAFEALLRKFPQLRDGSKLPFVCIYIGRSIEKDLQSFLLSAGARLVYWPSDDRWLEKVTLSDICILEREKNLGGIPELPSFGTFTLSFFPRRPPTQLTMVELELEEDLTDKSLDRLFDIRPRRIICKQQPWTEKFSLETRGFQRGDYAGKFLFYPSEPQQTFVFPGSIPFRFSVSSVLRIIVPEPLRFGPTGLKGKYQESKEIYIQAERGDPPGNLKAIDIDVAISLPEGLQVKAHPVLREGMIEVQVAVSLDEEAAVRPAQGNYEGKIKFSSPTGWAFSQNELPFFVNVAKKPIDFRRLGFYAGMTAGALAAACIILLLSFRRIRTEVADYLAKRAKPVGKLVPVRDPTRGLAKTLNLFPLAQRKRKKEIVIGIGEEVDVEISHISMVDKTFHVSGLKTEEGILTCIEGRQNAQVLVNGIPRVGKAALKHLDHVKLGSFEYRYEELLLLQQVVLYYLSGEVRQGWLLEWDIEKDGFHFVRRNEGQPSEEYVRFYELKAVAFVRDFDGEVSKNLLSLKMPRSGHRVYVTFADQEEMSGYVFERELSGDKFYLFPHAVDSNILFLLVEQHAVIEVKLLKENKTAAKKVQKKFEKILQRMTDNLKAKARTGGLKDVV